MPDYHLESIQRQESADAQLAHGNHKVRLKNVELAIEPIRAIDDLLPGRHAISARRFLSWETATDSSQVNRPAKLRLAQAARSLKPAKQCSSRGPGEGPSQDRFLVAGRLA